jgi:hypothetical protein
MIKNSDKEFVLNQFLDDIINKKFYDKLFKI